MKQTEEAEAIASGKTPIPPAIEEVFKSIMDSIKK